MDRPASDTSQLVHSGSSLATSAAATAAVGNVAIESRAYQSIKAQNNEPIKANHHNQRTKLSRILIFTKRLLKIKRFFLVIDLKKGVSISAMSVIITNLIDLLWHLSMTFGPLNESFSFLILMETFLTISVSLSLLYALKPNSHLELRSSLLVWLIVEAIDYIMRLILVLVSLFISQKASISAKLVRLIYSSIVMIFLAHCWLCVFSYLDEIKDKTTTVKITPSEDVKLKKSMLARAMNINTNYPSSFSLNTSLLSRNNSHNNSSSTAKQLSSVSRGVTSNNMLRAPDAETAPTNRW